jgi:hypothetical protein
MHSVIYTDLLIDCLRRGRERSPAKTVRSVRRGGSGEIFVHHRPGGRFRRVTISVASELAWRKEDSVRVSVWARRSDNGVTPLQYVELSNPRSFDRLAAILAGYDTPFAPPDDLDETSATGS